jgi:hypothetical protein
MNQIINNLSSYLVRHFRVTVCLVLSVSIGPCMASLSIDKQGKVGLSTGYRSGDVTRTGEACAYNCGQESRGAGSISINRAEGPIQARISSYDDGRKAAAVSAALLQGCKGIVCGKVALQAKVTFDSRVRQNPAPQAWPINGSSFKLNEVSPKVSPQLAITVADPHTITYNKQEGASASGRYLLSTGGR